MKTLVPNYTLSGNTVTLGGVNTPQDHLLFISDATTGQLLYSPAGPTLAGYSTVSGGNSVATLSSTPNSGDLLTIYYDNGSSQSTVNIGASTQSSTSTFTSTSSASILSSNAARKGAILSSPATNTGICYVTVGTSTTSSTAFSFFINPGDVISLNSINNALTGIWSSSGNTLYVTELS